MFEGMASVLHARSVSPPPPKNLFDMPAEDNKLESGDKNTRRGGGDTRERKK